MLAVIVAVLVALVLALLVTGLLLWRAYRLIHELEHILADEVDHVRALELQLLHARRIT